MAADLKSATTNPSLTFQEQITVVHILGAREVLSLTAVYALGVANENKQQDAVEGVAGKDECTIF